ncbi:MAG TPA: ABC transporter ATP-binding protein [Burkholderiales bacterium]|nr:ABC transporter ATP-binding protein [Burkholderiales bacterium]
MQPTVVPPLSPLLSVRALTFRWPRAPHDVIDIEALDLRPAEMLFVRGPSGCGKSTLLSLLAGVLTATSGEVSLLGQDWRTLSTARRDQRRADHVGYIFQQFNLLPYLSVLDNVLLPTRFSAQRAGRASERGRKPGQSAQALLEELQLGAAFWKRAASELSVGQQQRVAAARALIGRPELVIADEPTSALDEALREAFMELLLRACAAAGSALVFVSHDARLAERFERQVDLPTLNHRAGAAAELQAA